MKLWLMKIPTQSSILLIKSVFLFFRKTLLEYPHCDVIKSTAFDRDKISLAYMISFHEKVSIIREKG